MSIPVRKPTVETDGGPWANHDMACSVCGENHAVLMLYKGTFQPCWSCMEKGYFTIKVPGWLKWLGAELAR